MKSLLIGDKVKIVKVSSNEDRKAETVKGKVIAIFDEFILVRHKNYLEAYLKKNFLIEKRRMKLFVERNREWIEFDKCLLRYENFDGIEG